MPRRADPPALQKAKGNPGRRKGKVAKREEEIARVAELLSSAPADQVDPLAPPAILDGGPLCAAAIAVWKDLAPKLHKTRRLQLQHRPIFAMFCVYFAEWVIANEDVKKNGHTQSVPTVSGGSMERMRPIVTIRDRAFAQVMLLSDRFGLTPSDEYALFKDQAIAAATNPGLFDHREKDAPRDPAEPHKGQPVADGVVGSMKRMDSAPPPQRYN